MSLRSFILKDLITFDRIRPASTRANRFWSSAYRVENGHYKSEKSRFKSGKKHRVEYFHQADDPYSYLTAQVLKKLTEHYDIDLVPYLVSTPDNRMIASIKMEEYIKFRREDAAEIAPFYDLDFPDTDTQPAPQLKQLVDRILVNAIEDGSFFSIVGKVTQLLWLNDAEGLGNYKTSSESDTQEHTSAAENKRLKQGYVYGSTFYHGGEWYLGVDRINFLEERLIAQGGRKLNKHGAVVPRPQDFTNVPVVNNTDITVEFFPSVRSPYTAIAIPRLIDLIKRSKINSVIRPVLPVIMRQDDFTGARACQAAYIYADAAREARRLDMPYGNLVDCVGTPVKNCYSLFPWARSQNKGLDLLAAFTDGCFTRGIDPATNKGMQTIVENAGLDWRQAITIMGNRDWEVEVDQNLKDMYAMGQWGVPSFRISGGGLPPFDVWGQDRFFLIEEDIRQRARNIIRKDNSSAEALSTDI